MVHLLEISVLLYIACRSSSFLSTRRAVTRPSHSQLNWSVETDSFGSLITTKTVETLNSTYDLRSPPEWLEFNELEKGNGAYTVIRCDYKCRERIFKIWGREFHIDRLEASYKTLKSLTAQKTTIAKEKSKKLVEVILKAAESTLKDVKADSDRNTVVIVMVTILWQPLDSDINIRGHAFSTLDTTQVINDVPDPIQVAIAVDEQRILPDRFNDCPQSKLSTWCRRRRPLEQSFKRKGVGEVILTKMERDGKIQLLEGLTSNVFVIYPGNVLRTPPNDLVLGGYARHLVLETAARCGLEVEIGPILMDESSLWLEMFVTSSIRLVSPVREIIVLGLDPSSILPGDMERGEYFEGTLSRDQTIKFDPKVCKWSEILYDILENQGYEG
eukprot:scaffold2783_cov129-Cylindrotheca_fusiformis.AAC.11